MADSSKIWFITGASSGFGQALATAALQRGEVVIGTFRKQQDIAEFTSQHPTNAHGYELDITNPAQVAQVAAAAWAQFGRLDVLVNNAGHGFTGVVEETSLEEARRVMETNFFGTLAVTKAFLPHLRAQGSGHILQISSSAGFVGTPSSGLYSASKFAVEGFSEALAGEVEPFGLHVTIVEPGAFRTNFMGALTQAQQPVPAYPTSVVNIAEYVKSVDGQQPGDPAKAAQAMIKVVESAKPPLRLALEGSCIDSIRQKLKQVAAELDQWEAVGRATTF